MVKVTIVVLLALFPVVVRAAPPAPPPPPPDPSVAVPRHVRAVADHLARAAATDGIGRRALAEARTSVAAAKEALGMSALRQADEWAASADDLIRAVDRTVPGPAADAANDPASVLGHIGILTAALAPVQQARVHELIAFSQSVAGEARSDAARDDSNAGWVALRAEAIARAAAHVAIAVDPSLAPILPPPPPPRPPRQPAEARP